MITFVIDYIIGPLLQTAFILGVELVGTPYRVFCGIFIEYFFVLGEAYLVAFAYLTRYYHINYDVSSSNMRGKNNI